MNFKQAVDATEHLANHWKAGLQALRAQDRPHIDAEDTRALSGSVDVDSAYQQAEPNANRWDFTIAYQHTDRDRECIYWVEIHTASDAEVKVVLNKVRWLKAWLADRGSLLRLFERDIVWVSSGSTSFTLNAPQRKQFAELGLIHRGTVLRIPKERGPK